MGPIDNNYRPKESNTSPAPSNQLPKLGLKQIEDLKGEATKQAELYLTSTENCELVPPEQRGAFLELIGSETNKSALAEALFPALKCNSKERADTIQADFMRNLERAYLRSEEHFPEIREMLYEGGLEQPTLDSIDVINGSDPHCGGKRACFLHYDSVRLDNFMPSGSAYNDEEGCVVYKPRDMRPEELLVDRKSGLFAHVNKLANKEVLPTYSVYTAKDQEGSFGFSEFIQREFNLYRDESGQEKQQSEKGLSDSELSQFYENAGVLQAFAQGFGLSDLHRANTIVAVSREGNYFSYPIDLETAFDPRVVNNEYTTGFIQDFKAPDDKATNFIISKEGNSPLGRRGLVDHPEDRQAIRNGFEKGKNLLSLHSESLKIFAEEADKLTHRIVPIATKDLEDLIYWKEPPVEHAAKAFAELTTAQLEKYGATAVASPATLESLFVQDYQHGNIPYFVLNNRTGEILMNGTPIAEMKTPSIKNSLNNIADMRIEKTAGSILN